MIFQFIVFGLDLLTVNAIGFDHLAPPPQPRPVLLPREISGLNLNTLDAVVTSSMNESVGSCNAYSDVYYYREGSWICVKSSLLLDYKTMYSLGYNQPLGSDRLAHHATEGSISFKDATNVWWRIFFLAESPFVGVNMCFPGRPEMEFVYHQRQNQVVPLQFDKRTEFLCCHFRNKYVLCRAHKSAPNGIAYWKPDWWEKSMQRIDKGYPIGRQKDGRLMEEGDYWVDIPGG